MKTFAHPIMLEDADLDYVTGGGYISGANSFNQGIAFSGDVFASGNTSNSFNNAFNTAAKGKDT